MTEIIDGTAVDVTPGQALTVVPSQQAVAVRIDRGSDPLRYLGLMSAEDFAEEVQVIRAGTDRIGQIYKNLMREGTDYGVIPGTKNASLLQPGAERLAMIARLVPRHEQRILTVAHAGHPDELVVHTQTYLHFESLGGPVKGTAVASCSTYEERYRWRTKERDCPGCGKPSIIRGNPKYAPRTGGDHGPVLPGYDGGGWLCWKKKDGCGKTFADNDLAITGQAVGKVENEEPHALINTVVQISAKRGFVGAVRHTLGITDLFTQDVEDMPEYQRDAPAAATATPAPAGRPQTSPKATTAPPTGGPAPTPGASSAKGTAASFPGPVMATPDGTRDTANGKVLNFAIKVGSSKHNVELWGPAAVAALPHIIEGVQLRVDGVRTEEEWPGRGDKPKKKVIKDVTSVVVADTGETIYEHATVVQDIQQSFAEPPAMDPTTAGTGSATPAGSGAGPSRSSATDGEPPLPFLDGPAQATGDPSGTADITGSLRTIRWDVLASGVRFVNMEVVVGDLFYRLAMKADEAREQFVDDMDGFLFNVGQRVHVMGGWNGKGTVIVPAFVVAAEGVV